MKVSHFGGTAGLFNGFVIITIFEFFHLGIAFLAFISKGLKTKEKRTNVSEVKEQSNEKTDTNYNVKYNLNDMTQNFEAIQNEVDAMKREIKNMVDIHVFEDILDEKMKSSSNSQKL